MNELLAVLPAATLIFLFGVPFVVGLLAGFQGVWQRFQYDAFRALKTPPGTAYLLSRGVVPLGLFWGLYTHRALSSTDASSWGLAVGCGVGSEAILRAKVYVKTDQQGADSYAGLFDLLKFYQDLCLEAAASWLARWRKALVSRSMNNGPAFPNVLGRVRQNLQGLNDPALLLSPAQDSDTHVRSVEFFCHSRARIWRARGIPNSAGGRGEGPGFFARQPRARMTEQEIEQDRNCHYDLQRLDSPRDCRWRQTYPRRTPEKGVGRVEICVAD